MRFLISVYNLSRAAVFLCLYGNGNMSSTLLKSFTFLLDLVNPSYTPSDMSAPKFFPYPVTILYPFFTSADANMVVVAEMREDI